MSFLTNAKDLAEAKAKIATLEAASAALISERDALTAKLAELNGEIAGDNEAAIALTASVQKLTADLAAEKLAHEATKASVESVAAVKAQQIAASVGVAPVTVGASGQAENKVNREAFSKMSAAAQMKHIKSGGIVID